MEINLIIYQPMKKTLFALVMSVIMIGFASCGGSNSGSKAFNDSKKILEDVKEAVQQADNCDDVDMAAFGVLGLLAVEGIENLTEAEQEALGQISEEIEEISNQKKAELNCEEETSYEDEDMPADELIDYEEE